MSSTYANRLEFLSMQYELALKNAVSDGDGIEALENYMRAAMAQYELSELTVGESSDRHRLEMRRLLNYIRDEIVRHGIAVPDEVKQRMARFGICFPGIPTSSEAPAQDKPATQEHASSIHKAVPIVGSDRAKKASEKTDDLYGFDPKSVRLTELPAASFDDFGDMGDSVEAIVECLKVAHRKLEYPELARQMSDKRQNILLYGPPGGGKSHFCKAIGNYVLNNFQGGAFYIVQASQIKHSLVGVAEKRLNALFMEVEQHDMPVICIDEIDSLCPPRDGDVPTHVSALVTEFLQHIDGVDGKSKAVIIGATNYPWKIDKAIRSRLSTSAYVGLPTMENILDYLMHRIKRYLGNDEKFIERMLQLCTSRLENASYRVLEWVWQEVETLSFNKTTQKNPQNKTVSEFVALTEEELLRIINRVSVDYDADYIMRLQDKNRWERVD